MARVVGAAGEGEILGRASPAFQPRLQTGAGSFEQLELDRPARFLLGNGRSRSHLTSAHELANPYLHDVAAAQLTVSREVEQRAIADAAFSVEPEPNGPDLLWLKRALCPNDASSVSRPPLPDCRVKL